MRIRTALAVSVLSLAAVAGAFAWQKPFRQYQGVEYREFVLPPDYQEKTEWVFARLMYPPGPNDGYRGRFDRIGGRCAGCGTSAALALRVFRRTAIE